MEDHEIIDMFFARQETAITETRLKYNSRLFRTAKNILHSNEDAEECVSDALLKTWDAIPPNRPEKLGAYITKIARNLALNRWEARNTAKRGGGEVNLLLSELEDCIPSGSKPDEVYEATLVTEAINVFLENTAKTARNTFVLRYFHGESIQSISDRFQVSESKVKKQYHSKMGNASNEIFAQFLTRIFLEIPNCKICEFSKLKALIAPNFKNFRNFFTAKFLSGFVAPANTFDNVKGSFPIGFKIWDTKGDKHLTNVSVSVYGSDGGYIGQKKYYDGTDSKYINDWYKNYYDKKGSEIGILNTRGNDFQNQNYIYFSTENNHNHTSIISANNLLQACIYLTVRKIIPANWLNDRDQFFHPNKDWEKDNLFQTDCFVFALFHNSNNISIKHGINHWIPFTEKEVNAHTRFESNFMTNFIAGKVKKENNGVLNFSEKNTRTTSDVKGNSTKNIALMFSERAKLVFEAGKTLWKYYHSLPNCNINASFYDIRDHFQGRDDKGRMKNTSNDDEYNRLMSDLRLEMKYLAKQIEPKIYKYAFLKGKV